LRSLRRIVKIETIKTTSHPQVATRIDLPGARNRHSIGQRAPPSDSRAPIRRRAHRRAVRQEHPRNPAPTSVPLRMTITGACSSSSPTSTPNSHNQRRLVGPDHRGDLILATDCSNQDRPAGPRMQQHGPLHEALRQAERPDACGRPHSAGIKTK